ncbi:MAG TPA: ribbon-helix-helix domain-containing protein [Tepidiformaceae bacterium]|nr:ribbon-helix-helix domain-containing protein [Tepidiformaceae bacterium]
MKRITISLPDDLADTIARESRIRRKSVSEIVRKSLSEDFCAGEPRHLAFANLVSGPDDWHAADLDDFRANTGRTTLKRTPGSEHPGSC